MYVRCSKATGRDEAAGSVHTVDDSRLSHGCEPRFNESQTGLIGIGLVMTSHASLTFLSAAAFIGVAALMAAFELERQRAHRVLATAFARPASVERAWDHYAAKCAG